MITQTQSTKQWKLGALGLSLMLCLFKDECEKKVKLLKIFVFTNCNYLLGFFSRKEAYNYII